MTTETKGKIAVLGAGTMGPGIAAVYAVNGYETALYSRTEKTLEKARVTVEGILELFREEKMFPEEAVIPAAGRISYVTDLSAAVHGAFYVSETVAEVPEVKKEIFRQLDELLPEDVFLSSNTSYMNVFELAPERRQARLAIVHWVAPPHILPLVEVVRGPETAEETMEAMMVLHEACGKLPVRMEKYIPGFILNRLQSAMNREVIGLMQEGYVSPEMLDRAVKASLMPRGLLLGVVQRMDFNGLDMVARGLRNRSFEPFGAPPEDNVIAEMAERGELGVKSGAGFYDYGETGSEEAMRLRDRYLIESVRLARYFMERPIGAERKRSAPED